VDSREATAFICPRGNVYQWKRVAMGLKGAASHFQMTMVTETLEGLVGELCEAYLDDINVFDNTEDTFVQSLRTVFQRLVDRKITIGPHKCRLGLETITYVGHEISQKGIWFNETSRDQVMNAEYPRNIGELRSFLGRASYFRDHVRHYVDYAKPLQDLVVSSKKNVEIPDSRSLRAAFARLKLEIRNCTFLFFIEAGAETILTTDASEYGIGAFLFQIIEGKVFPIAFMSRLLTEQECRWNTTEKECYAIVAALKKFEYLLRDTAFTLRTDHKNLTYLKNDNLSPKVRRWKIWMAEFDMRIEFIKGADNTIADSLSRVFPIKSRAICAIEEIPTEYANIIAKYHGGERGHGGVERTLSLIRAAGSKEKAWQNQRAHVRQFIRTCSCCQKMSVLKVPIHTVPFTLAAYRPMERLYLDTMTFNVPDEEGNEHVLVIIDAFTKWVELFPTKSTTAREAAVALLTHIGRFGEPKEIYTDKGSQFVNELFSELKRLIELDHLITTPYSKEENGMVENANKQVLRHVRTLIFDKEIGNNWSLAIPFVQRIMNTTKKVATGATPAELLFSTPHLLEGRVFDPREMYAKHELKDKDMGKWIARCIQTQKTTVATAESLQREMDERNIAKRRKEGGIKEFPVGSYVLLEYPAMHVRTGAPNKLLTIRKGPMKVADVNINSYTVEDLITGKFDTVNITRLNPWLPANPQTDPIEIARKDRQEFVLDYIIAHEGLPQCKTKMLFLVKWRGYDDSENTWEPWNNLRDTEALHIYLRENKLSRLIPKGSDK
jgi:transposase InsO family protein